MSRRPSIVALAAFLLAVMPPAVGLPQALPDVKQLVARPASPGGIAALLTHVAGVSAQARLVTALKDPDAGVRAVAAHVVYVARARLAMAALSDALQRETDDSAAAAMVRAVATFDGPTRLDELVAIAKARGPAARAALLESLARSHPALLARVASDAGVDETSLVTPLAVASAQHAAERGTLARAALARGAVLWTPYLRTMHEHLVAVDPATLKDALASRDEALRAATAYHVAVLAGHIHGTERSVLETAANGAETGASTTWERAYRELARRALGRPARPVDWPSLVAPDAADARRRRFAEVNASLLGADREAVQALVGAPLPGAEWFLRSAGRDHPERRVRKTRTLASVTAAVVPDLMRVFGCSPTDRRSFAAATMIYGVDGRPRFVRPADTGLDAACKAVAHTAFLLTIAPPAQPVLPQASDGIFLPFSPEYLACLGAPAEPVHAVDPGRVLPRPRGRLLPEYPKAVKALRISGTVTVEAEITSRGCAREVETLSSLDPWLDVETLRTVLASPFEPLVVDGRPVASRVALTVTFKP